jgi:ketosteroid isomerase-like protein
MSRMVCAAVFFFGLGCRSGIDASRETQTLLDADRAWAHVASTSRNIDSVITFWTDDARVAMPNAPLVRGKSALREMVSNVFAVPGLQIMWTPEKAVVAASGDVGYTTGTNEMSVPDSSGKVTKTIGRYIKVWRRESDGRWRSVEEYTSPAPLDARPRA